MTASPSAAEQRKFLDNTIKPGGVAGVPESYYRKALDLNRFSNGVANKLLESYRRQIVKAVRELERIDKMPSSKKPQFKAARMRALIKQNLDAMKQWSGQSINELIQQLDGLADVEVAFARAELQRVVPAAVKTQVRTVEVTESFAKAVVKADPLDVGTNLLQDSFEEAVKGPGAVMKLTARQGAVIRMPDGTSIVKAFRGLAERQGDLFSRAVLDGLLTGESTESIARSLYGELGFSTEALTPRQVALAQQGNAWKMAKHQVRTLVRTSVNATSNAASLQVYKANPNLTKKYRWIATLDSNTTAICRNLDQKEFFYGKGPTPSNPPHFGCRSTTVPVIDYAGASKKFGIDIPPPSSKIGYRPTKEGTPSSADPKGGRVPVGTSAAQHLYDLRGTTKAGKKSRFDASPAQARMLNGGNATPGAFEKARYYNRLADRYGPDGAMKRFMREDGSEVSLKQLRSRYGEPDKITKSKKAAAPKAKPTTKILTKNEKIAKQVMQDPALKSDKKRIEAMVNKGVPKNTDFVGLIASAKQKSGLTATEKFAKVKPKPKPKPPLSTDAQLNLINKQIERLDKNPPFKREYLLANNAKYKNINERVEKLEAQYKQTKDRTLLDVIDSLDDDLDNIQRRAGSRYRKLVERKAYLRRKIADEEKRFDAERTAKVQAQAAKAAKTYQPQSVGSISGLVERHIPIASGTREAGLKSKDLEDALQQLTDLPGESGRNAKAMVEFLERSDSTVLLTGKMSAAENFEMFAKNATFKRTVLERRTGRGADIVGHALRKKLDGEETSPMYERQIQKFLNKFMQPSANSNGHAFKGYNFVSVKHGQQLAGGKFNAKQLQARVNKKLDDIDKGDPSWSFSHNATKDASSTMSTLIHEIGHVVQYMDETSDDRLGIRLRAKRKLTEYSGSNDREAFAEGFVAFVLQPKKLKEMRPELYDRVRKSLFEFLAK